MSSEPQTTGRRLRASLTASVLIAFLLTGCVPDPPLSPAAAPSEIVDGDPDDGLTFTQGGTPSYVELTDGFFADDEDALAASLATYEEFIDRGHVIALSGDPSSGDLSGVLMPAMEDSVRSALTLAFAGLGPIDDPAEITDAFIIRRMEDEGGARVFVAVCQALSSQQAGVKWTGEQEVALSLVSTGEDPRHLRIEAMLEWSGEPIC